MATRCPKPGFVNRHDRVRKAGDSTIELKDAVDYDAEYIVRVNLIGHRGANDKPVTCRISVDGKPIKEVEVPVQISAVNRQGGATQRDVEESTRLSHSQRAHLPRRIRERRIREAAQRAGTRQRQQQYLSRKRLKSAGPIPPAEPQPGRKRF